MLACLPVDRLLVMTCETGKIRKICEPSGDWQTELTATSPLAAWIVTGLQDLRWITDRHLQGPRTIGKGTHADMELWREMLICIVTVSSSNAKLLALS